MIVFPNAKINLGLRVLRKRDDGFHDLDTIFVPVPLFDILEVRRTNSDSINIQGFIPDGELDQNLVMQALFLLRKDFNIPPCRVFLYKQIPIGAGLGGGSADAAFMLMLLNEFFNLNIGRKKMGEYALQLGSDVPFFLENKILRAKARGQVFQKINLQLAGLWLLIIFPHIYVSTRIAFSDVNPIDLSLNLPFEKADWADYLSNDFEKTVYPRYPKLADIKHYLYSIGAFYASMSGSGSVIFGFFNEKPTLLSINNDYFYRLLKL